jgi:predicted metalloprotease with PDZ domain
LIACVRQIAIAVVWLAIFLTPSSWAANSSADSAVHYTISLANAAEHLVLVEIVLPPGAHERVVQLPVWNALYQVRDFAQYITWMKAATTDGKALPMQMLDKSSWRIENAEAGVSLRYQIFADQPGPFGAQLNLHHAFMNLAEVLVYAADSRKAPITLRLLDIPKGWRVASPLAAESAAELNAENYDRLVDSPVEIGPFQESSFEESGARYRIVVDADPSDYNMEAVSKEIRKIVVAADDWMQDRPYQNYLFIYHFPRGPAGGGMEHAYSTAIDVSANRLRENPASLTDVTAHEFFHLWNVKRIRPQSLEPIDYTKENYTTALWFSEGFTSTVANLLRLRAGLIDESRFLRSLGGEITQLQRRPAHQFQSAEASSLDAWLEKYDYYNLPSRSISYYNKGYLLGVMLDLQLRESSHGQRSLRDLFQWMNTHYAQEHRFFPDTEGVRQAAEAVTHADFHSFFDKYVAGTDELPYDDFFRTVGLHVVRRVTTVSDPGFRAVSNFGALPSVAQVTPEGPAAKAGLFVGDTIVRIGEQTPAGDLEEQLSQFAPADVLQLEVRNAAGDRKVALTLGSREEVEFKLQDVENVSPLQRARRQAWLSGESEHSGETRP